MITDGGTMQVHKIEDHDDTKGDKKSNVMRDKQAYSLKESMCLFPADGNQDLLLSEGRSYRLPSSNERTAQLKPSSKTQVELVTWPVNSRHDCIEGVETAGFNIHQQFNFLVTNPIDFINISVIVECSPPNDKDPVHMRKYTVGKASIPLAELALFMDDVNHEKPGGGKPLTFAVAMEYIPSGDELLKEKPKEFEVKPKRYGYDYLKEEDDNHKNLLSNAHSE
jgi:hypothetical protein